MSVMLLLILVLVSMQPIWPEAPQWLDDLPGGPLTATCGSLTLVWIVGSLYTSLCCWAVRSDPTQARRRLRHFQSRQKIYFFLLTGTFLASCYFLGWGDYVSVLWWDEGRRVFWPGKQLALLAPFLLGLTCSWARFYDAEKTVYQAESGSDRPFLSRRAYLGLQVRFNLLLIAPPLMLMLLKDSFSWAWPAVRHSELAEYVFFSVFLLVFLLGMPWMLRLFLRLRPLPEGPLRERLEATVRRLKFRFSGILLWNTRHTSANAFVTGILPWPRYIVLTDQLLRDLAAEEVEAVIGHEIGHVKHYHMFFYMIFLFASFTSLELLWQLCQICLRSTFVLDLVPALRPWMEKESFELISAFPLLLAMALYLFVVFGYLSRYCETQADIFGSRTISNEVFISALEKVAILNCIPRDKPGWLSSWRHPTIANRVDFLRRMGEDPGLERRFQRRIGLFKWSLALALCVILVTLLNVVPYDNPVDGKPDSGDQQSSR